MSNAVAFTDAVASSCKINNSPFSEEFNILVGSPYYFNHFFKVEPVSQICAYVEEAPFSIHETIFNFTCPQSSCFRWCSYNNNCMYSQYSNVTKTCTRSTSMQLTDGNKQTFSRYLSYNYITYARNTVGSIPFYSQLCVGRNSKKSCKIDKNCNWDTEDGYLGYNNAAYALCSRTACVN